MNGPVGKKVDGGWYITRFGRIVGALVDTIETLFIW